MISRRTIINYNAYLANHRTPSGGSGGAPIFTFDFTTSMPSSVAVNSSPAGYAPTAAGVLTSFAAGAGRRTNAGLLVEPATNNYCGRAIRLDQLDFWARGGCTVSVPNYMDPVGNATGAVAMIEDAGNNSHVIAGVPAAPAGAYTYSIYSRSGGRKYLALYEGLLQVGKYFDIESLTVGADLIGPPTGARITAAASGWVRSEITFSYTSATSQQLNVFMSDTGSRFSYLGNGSTGTFIWGAQLEVGSLATSLIDTANTLPVGRVADNVSFTIPAGVTTLTYTFDDNSTQQVSVSPGAYTIPTNLNRRQIKQIVGS